MPIAERVALPRRIADGMRRIVAILPRLRAGRTMRAGRNNDIVTLANRMLEVVAAAP